MRFKAFYDAFGPDFSPFGHNSLLEHVERET